MITSKNLNTVDVQGEKVFDFFVLLIYPAAGRNYVYWKLYPEARFAHQISISCKPFDVGLFADYLAL
jgi:hypothetical protein